jgi:hypothetical protein
MMDVGFGLQDGTVSDEARLEAEQARLRHVTEEIRIMKEAVRQVEYACIICMSYVPLIHNSQKKAFIA